MHKNCDKIEKQPTTSNLISTGKSPYMISVRRKSKLFSKKNTNHDTNNLKNHDLIELLSQNNKDRTIIKKQKCKKNMFKRFNKFQPYQPENSNFVVIRQRSNEKLAKYHKKISQYNSNKSMSVCKKDIIAHKFSSYKSINTTLHTREFSNKKFRTRSHSKPQLSAILANKQTKEDDWLSKELINKQIYTFCESSDQIY